MGRNALVALGLVASLALPAGAVAKPTKTDKRHAAKECKLERGTTDAEREAFAAKYGTNASGRNAFGKCVSQTAREERTERVSARRSAAKDCREERAQDPDAFREKYGTNRNKRNAFGKCVSGKAKGEMQAEDAEDVQEIEEAHNAAKECAAEREADPQAFADTYGTNRNKRNAFGKCVASKAGDDDGEEEQPES